MSDPTPTPAPAPVVPVAPVPVMDTTSIITTIETEVKKVFDEFKADKADGKISVSEVVQLLEDAVGSAMIIAKPFKTASVDIGVLVTTALTQLYEKEIRPLELQHFGLIISATVIDPIVKQVIPLLVESAKKLISSL